MEDRKWIWIFESNQANSGEKCVYNVLCQAQQIIESGTKPPISTYSQTHTQPPKCVNGKLVFILWTSRAHLKIEMVRNCK